MKYNSEDYLFLCARINARMSNLITKEKCGDIAGALSDREFFSSFSELGVDFNGHEEILSLPDIRLELEFGEIMKGVPNPELFTLFTYPCDCHNLKSAVKCEIKGVPPDKLLIPMGSVSSESVAELVRGRDFSAFPECMARAAENALEGYAKNHNPQTLDILLDSACFGDILCSIEKNPLEYFKELLAVKADMTNVLSCVRIKNTSFPNPEELMKRAFAVGGRLDKEVFDEVFLDDEKGIGQLMGALQANGYWKIASALEKGTGELSELCERMYAERALNTSIYDTGAEAVAKYLVQIELEARNLRCLITGRRLGYSREKIISMLCEAV